LKRLAFAIFERYTAEAVGCTVCVDHDVIGGDATRKEVGADEDSCNFVGICFRRVGDERSPNRKELAQLERIPASRKIKLELRKLIQVGIGARRHT
jgi:hypothetical protein